MKTDVLVLGAGIVGVSSALHLLDRGRSVVLVDRADPGSGTSYGNAGLIERSSVIPYSFPRDPLALLRYVLNGQSDVRYDPFFLPKAASFLWKYWRNSAPGPLEVATRAMLPLVEACLPEHDRLVARAGAGHLIRADGWVALYKTTARFDAAVAEAGRLSPYGLAHRILTPQDFIALEPAYRPGIASIAGAIHWQDPKTVTDPQGLVKAYAELFVAGGGTMARGDAATLTEIAGGWQVTGADGETITAREVVVALGPQSGLVFRKAGYRIPLGIKRGYHRHYTQTDGAMPRLSVVDEESGYVLAPMRQGLRITTGIEFADPAAPAKDIQIRRDEAAARKLLPLGTPVEQTPWLGLRPCLPDMRPVIGPAARHTGLWFHFGHAHHGLTLGPASGRLLAEMMTGETPFVDPTPYAATRFA
ncbi:NAD(P)/FAD-dependent oxidoreductase [Rhizobium sp. SG2393]|uniref:NAD(P)/FAD-dependent oxidoreductase n=1 Tax=Rhizobium sp. SG2393 TaxID=3276279 RepID=UPI00366E5EB8